MPAGKRKLELFDPNKSDPDDENYESGQDKPARRPSRKSKSGGKRSSGSKRRRTTYGGSDISDEDASDSLLEESFEDSEDSEEEEDMDPVTGRRKRQATKKGVNYEEASDEELDEKSETSEDDIAPSPNRPRPSRVVKLKVPSLMGTPVAPARSSRAGSTARGRGGVSTEPTSTVPRRSTRAHTEEGDELIALSNSGRHVIRSSKSPEALVRARQSRGGKSLKAPASIIKEEEHETSSYEQAEAKEDLPVDTEMTEAVQVDAGADVADAEGEPDEDELVLESTQYAQVAETSVIPVDDEDDEDEDVPVTRRTRASRTSISAAVLDLPAKEAEAEASTAPANRRLTRKSSARKTGIEQSSDFEPVDESGEEEISASDASPKKDDYDSERPRGRRAAQGKSKSTRSSRRRNGSDEDGEDEIDEDEVLEEALELKAGRRSRRAPRDNDILYERPSARVRKPVDYTIKQLDTLYAADEEGEDITATPSRKPRGGRGGASQPWERPLYTTFGPFGGAGGPPPVIGGPWGTGATGGVDSDSSDDEGMQRPSGIGGNVGMTPTSAMPGGLLPGMGQTNPMDPAAATGGTPANFGKVKSQKALADADPLGVDQDVDFSKVGGLEGHIDQLKEMVQMPLLYPELFLKFHVTPPRGVLFHGPPGTGKTLLARALAASVGSGGRKITFYMRKGADALSKWVGEAERQLRLLFEEARKTQPSIIFFDEIDGLAPVRSSKQEQIHASIVSTLLALMDGMDGRGQVIVIGATNRPDNIDPALRRPGRFDREFYFPLPGIDGRKSIINIHTRDWGIDEAFKDSLAQATKGYGGADLRALCTEAALNAIQRTYPQIYSSNDKLIVDPDKIKITAKDFMLSIKKMIPSSERATSSGAAPLPKVVEPLLRDQLKSIESILDGLIPIKKKVTALQEAMFEQYEDEDQGFGRETLQQDFEKSRVFRPRLLIGGEPGMGQSYLGAALLNHFEGLHVQNFDLPTIYADSARSAETAIVQLFQEIKRHKPSVIFLPGIDTWWHTLSEAVLTTFLGLLRGIPPTDAVLVLGITDAEPKNVDRDMLRNLFGFSKKNQFCIERPQQARREEFFMNIVGYIKTAPKDFPEPVNRKLRKLETLEIAPPPPPKLPTKEDIKALKHRDHQVLNALKISIGPIMEQIHRKYKKFRNPVIPDSAIRYLFEEQDPDFVRPDVVQFRPFELEKDKDGIMGLRETSSGKFYYNLETTTIEERLSNGFYARPKDFVADIRSLAKDARNSGDKERTLKANELLANVEVDMASIEALPAMADCENVYQRQLQRAKDKADKYKKRVEKDAGLSSLVRSELPMPGQDAATESSSGPVILGEPVPYGRQPVPMSTPFDPPGSLSNGWSLQHISNGSTVPSRIVGEDVQMSGTDEASNLQRTPTDSQPMGPPTWLSRGPSSLSNYAPGTNTQFSQTSGFQHIPPGVSISSLINNASSTTSGNRTSDKSKRSSDQSTQLTNGDVARQVLDSQHIETQRDTEQVDTQGTSSGEKEWPHSQAHGMARGVILPGYPSQSPSSGSQSQPGAAARMPLFNDSAPAPVSMTATSAAPIDVSEPSSSQISTQRDMLVDDIVVDAFLQEMVSGSDGLSVEQLEQVNRELMDELWKGRGEWNRNLVVQRLRSVWEETVGDMQEMAAALRESRDHEPLKY